MKLTSVLLLVATAVSVLHVSEGQYLLNPRQQTNSAPVAASSGGTSSSVIQSPSADTTFFDRILTAVEPLRNINLRDAVTNMMQRMASFFTGQQAVQARDGRMNVYQASTENESSSNVNASSSPSAAKEEREESLEQKKITVPLFPSFLQLSNEIQTTKPSSTSLWRFLFGKNYFLSDRTVIYSWLYLGAMMAYMMISLVIGIAPIFHISSENSQKLKENLEEVSKFEAERNMIEGIMNKYFHWDGGSASNGPVMPSRPVTGHHQTPNNGQTVSSYSSYAVPVKRNGMRRSGQWPKEENVFLANSI